MTAADSSIQYWPLVLGWTVVALVYLLGWKRQALIGTAGMLIVSAAVLSVRLSGP